jgi:6-phosphogluconolactonase
VTAKRVLPVADFWVGTYTTSSARGIFPLGVDAATEHWRLGPPEAMIEHASYAAFSPRSGLFYMVNEQDNGRIGSWWRSPMGNWRRIQTVSSLGAAPCHLSLSADFNTLAVANYKSGTVATFQLDHRTGWMRDEPSVFENAGRGPDIERQDGPHAHCVRFAHGFLYSTDLGTDQVLSWPQTGAASSLAKPIVAFKAPAGEGPRHILFHPSARVAYLLTELASKLLVLNVEPSGELRLRETLSTLPDDFDGQSLGGHLELNAAGTKVYASNRGHDSLAVFDVGTDGGLSRYGIYPTFGKSPRHFVLAEDRQAILVAHQNGNTVDVIAMDDGVPGAHLDSCSVQNPAFVGRVPPSRVDHRPPNGRGA